MKGGLGKFEMPPAKNYHSMSGGKIPTSPTQIKWILSLPACTWPEPFQTLGHMLCGQPSFSRSIENPCPAGMSSTFKVHTRKLHAVKPPLSPKLVGVKPKTALAPVPSDMPKWSASGCAYSVMTGEGWEWFWAGCPHALGWPHAGFMGPWQYGPPIWQAFDCMSPWPYAGSMCIWLHGPPIWQWLGCMSVWPYAGCRSAWPHAGFMGPCAHGATPWHECMPASPQCSWPDGPPIWHWLGCIAGWPYAGFMGPWPHGACTWHGFACQSAWPCASSMCAWPLGAPIWHGLECMFAWL